MDQAPEPTIRNLIDQRTLKWIFVGGKGGVGKTTTSSSLAVLMSKHRAKVLIISTDPAHNLGDSFQQTLSAEPTLIKGFDNLYAMETQPKIEMDTLEMPDFLAEGAEGAEGGKNFWGEIVASAPGIDEVLVFTSVIKSIENMNFDLVIFDTAPTGHTLKLLNFPSTTEAALTKLLGMRDKLQGMMSMVALRDPVRRSRELRRHVQQSVRENGRDEKAIGEVQVHTHKP